MLGYAGIAYITPNARRLMVSLNLFQRGFSPHILLVSLFLFRLILQALFPRIPK